jgi:type II secretory pathway component PulC
MISLRYGIFSLFLCLIVLLLAFKNYETWMLPMKIVPEKEMSGKTREKIESLPMMKSQRAPADIQADISISNKNIFSPERKEFPFFPNPASGDKQPIVRPQIVLYGVTLAGDYQSASIVNPGRPLKRGEREMMSLKVGDHVGEYALTKILPDRIVMEAAGDSFEILLYDAKSPKQRTYVKTESKPATVTATTPLPAPSTSPTTIAPRVPMPRPVPTTPAITPNRPSSSTPTPSPSILSPNRRFPRGRSPISPPVTQPPAPAPEEDDDNDEEE